MKCSRCGPCGGKEVKKTLSLYLQWSAGRRAHWAESEQAELLYFRLFDRFPDCHWSLVTLWVMVVYLCECVCLSACALVRIHILIWDSVFALCFELQHITSSHGHTHITHGAFLVRRQKHKTNVIFQRLSDLRDYREQRGLKIQEGPVYVILINKLPRNPQRLLCCVQSLV